MTDRRTKESPSWAPLWCGKNSSHRNLRRTLRTTVSCSRSPKSAGLAKCTVVAARLRGNEGQFLHPHHPPRVDSQFRPESRRSALALLLQVVGDRTECTGGRCESSNKFATCGREIRVGGKQQADTVENGASTPPRGRGDHLACRGGEPRGAKHSCHQQKGGTVCWMLVSPHPLGMSWPPRLSTLPNAENG